MILDKNTHFIEVLLCKENEIDFKRRRKRKEPDKVIVEKNSILQSFHSQNIFILMFYSNKEREKEEILLLIFVVHIEKYYHRIVGLFIRIIRSDFIQISFFDFHFKTILKEIPIEIPKQIRDKNNNLLIKLENQSKEFNENKNTFATISPTQNENFDQEEILSQSSMLTQNDMNFNNNNNNNQKEYQSQMNTHINIFSNVLEQNQHLEEKNDELQEEFLTKINLKDEITFF